MKLNFLFFTFVLFSAIVFAQMEMKEGEWEITVKMEMEGMDFQMPPVTIKQCIKKDNPYPIVDEKKGKKPDCKFLKQETKGNTASWEMECKEGKNITYSKGSVTYKGNSFEGSPILNLKGMKREK